LSPGNTHRDSWVNFIQSDTDFIEIRQRFTNEYMDAYKQAFDCYIKGNWDLAKKLFEKSNYILDDNEYITDEILRYMSGFDFVAPENWKGFRLAESIGLG
jgi:hypothetical protein